MRCFVHLCAGLAFSVLFPVISLASPKEKVIYSFKGGKDGYGPWAGVVMDRDGALYGTTAYVEGGASDGGTIFRLTPPPAGKPVWTKTILYAFPDVGQDGYGPYGGVILDAKGNLYGTTEGGGKYGAGIVFRLMPPAGGDGKWSETILHNFFANHKDGIQPDAGLLMDAKGSLYGSTVDSGYDGYNGLVFKLAPPAAVNGAWPETILHNFKGAGDGNTPQAPLIMDSQGNLYGSTPFGGSNLDNGTVFKLTPQPTAGGAWAETILCRFTKFQPSGTPQGVMVMDAQGALYGTLQYGGPSGNGGVFKLTPPSGGNGAWTETMIYVFKEFKDGRTPLSGLAMGSKGVLYGTTSDGGSHGFGTVFKVTPPAAGKTNWTASVLYNFKGGADGAGPRGSVVIDKRGNLYGTTLGGGKGHGTVFEIEP